MNNDLDLLGLGQGDLDILGLGSRPVAVISSAPPDEGSFLGDLWDRFATDKEGEKAKAANALSLSEATGLPPSVVYDRMDEITQEMGLRDQPPFRDLIERPIMGAVTYGLLAHPMATVVGVASFGALAEAENYLVSRKEGLPYQFGAGRGLADMLPEETAQAYKDLIWTADMAWKAVAAGGAIKGARPAVEKFAVKYMRDVTETYNLPRNVYISPEKIREFHGLGRENIISTEEATMLKEMGLTRQQYVDGLKYGLDLEIPAEKLVTMVDKPWWAAMKGLFKVSPYEETVVSRGKATGDKAVSGLLGKPETAPKPAEFLTEQAATGTSPAEVGKVAAAEIVQPGATSGGKQPGLMTHEDFKAAYPSVPQEIIDRLGTIHLDPKEAGRGDFLPGQGLNIRSNEQSLLHEVGHAVDNVLTPEQVAQWETIAKTELKNGVTGKRPDRLANDPGYNWEDLYTTFSIVHKKLAGETLLPFEEAALKKYPKAIQFVKDNLTEASSVLKDYPELASLQAMKVEKPSEKGTANISAKENPMADAGKIGSKLSDEYVYHNTKSEYLDDIKTNGFDQGSFSGRPIDYGGDIWIAVKKSDLPNLQTHTVGKETWFEPGFDGGSIPADKIILVDKKGKFAGSLVPPETTPKAVGGINVDWKVKKLQEYEEGRQGRIDADDDYRLSLVSSSEMDVYKKSNPQLRSNPETVTIYRATEGRSISPGDWVYLRKDLAENHLASRPGAKVLSQKVPLSDIITASDDVEFVYSPKSLPNPSRPPEVGGRIETPAPEEISSIDYDDPNTLLEMAARSDEVAMPPQTTEYDKIRAQAASIAFENLSKKIDLKKRREAAAIRRQGIEDARGVPVFAAMDEAIKGGGLNRGWLEKIYDREMVNELARKRVGLVTKDGPFGLDQIAQMHGYDYADTLMNDLLAWEGLKAEGVKAAETFEEKYYDLLSEAEKEDFHLALLEEEAKILRKMIKATGKPSTPGIKKVIREQTGQTRVEELTVSEYDALKAGMKKAEQASRKAFREGKIEGALAEKERQIEMAETRNAKLEAKEEAKGIHDDIVRLTKDKSIPEDYRDRITSLLEDFDILPRSKKTAQRVESAREFLERQKQAGEDVTIPESMLNRIERYGKTHWRELTLDQLREIHDQAKMYEHLGKMKNKLLKARQKKDFEATVQGLIDEISKNWGIKQAGPADIEAMFLEPSALEGMGQFKDSYLGSLTKVETYLRRLDGFKDMGPVWERTYLPVKEASDAEYRNLADITGKLQKLFEPMKKTLTKEKFKIPGVNQFVTRETVIMVALNSGNEGNLNALKNTIYKWDDAQIQAILNNVTPDEWKLVRGIWDLFEEQFPKLSEVYKNLSGVNLKKVEGDYFPLVFDRKLSWIADKNATEQELRDFFKSIYTRPSVKSGSTIERVGGTLPPKLKFTVIFDKLAEINHYITHAEAVRDVQKILGDPRVRAAIEGTPAGIGGAVGYREMMTWLQDVARQKADPLSAVESAIKTARINTTAVAMAWKFSTAAVQWLGMGNSIYKLGMGEVAKGIAEFYTNREATVERIKGLSAEMAGRAKSFDRELRDAYNRIGLEHFRGSMALKDSFFSLISLMDMAVAYPTWVAAYNKGMKDYSDETKAVEFADMTVRMTQGNALTKDLAGIQRGSELKKILSMFYTFFSAYHQMMSDAWLKFKFDKTGQNFSDLMKSWWWLTLLPASMDYLMKERDVPSPGDFLKNVLQMRLTAYPVIRDLTGAVLTDYDYQFSPVARAGEVVARGAKEAVKLFTPGEEAELDKLLKYGIESAGYVFGLPTGQAVVTMQGLIDLMNGDTSDPTRLMFRAPREEE